MRRFPGTVSFEDNELSSQLFFGRDEEVNALYHSILAETLVVLYAKSGNGKSSLLQAKIFSRLRSQQYFPVLIRFNQKDESPFQVIENEVLSIGKRFDQFEVLTNFTRTDREDSLLELFQKTEIWSSDDKLYTPVLILDQFEEIFTLGHNFGFRDAFFTTLANLLQYKKDGLIDLKIIISIREDYFGQLKKMAINIPSVFTNVYQLDAIKVEKVDDIINGPASIQIKGVNFEAPSFTFSEDALSDLKNFLSLQKEEDVWKNTNSIEPIQLQIICSEIEERVITGEIRPVNGQIIVQESDLGGEDGLKNLLEDYYSNLLTSTVDKFSLNKTESDVLRALIEDELITGTLRVPVAYSTIIAKAKEGLNIDALEYLINKKLLKVEKVGSNQIV